MGWSHSVSYEWLNARTSVMTATEAMAAMPGFRRWKSRSKKLKEEFCPELVALWAVKHTDNPYLEADSFGAAARGHYMEPFALEQWNITMPDQVSWWDDFIVTDAVRRIGFSPDALDIPQPEDGARGNVEDLKPTHIVEIKSYAPSNHIKAVMVPAAKKPERYQIAYAMLVAPSIKYGSLFFYCPGLQFIGWYREDYSRQDLEKEIEELQELVAEWQRTCIHIKLKEWPNAGPTKRTEKEIHNMYEAERQEEFLRLKEGE